jgi:hypothetical protein
MARRGQQAARTARRRITRGGFVTAHTIMLAHGVTGPPYRHADFPLIVCRLAALAMVLAGCYRAHMAQAQGPIPEPITKGGLAVVVEDYVRMPQTGSGFLGQARINFLREEPGGADRLFVNDLNGFLYSVDKTSKEVTTYIDFQAEFPDLRTAPGMASGHVTFAFHPDFRTNGKFYTVHSEHHEGRATPTATAPMDPPLGTVLQHGVLTEWTATNPAADVFAGSRREVMRLGTLGWWHPMGDLGFDPVAKPGDEDYGLLYIAIGDGQSFHAGFGENAQTLDSYLGKILRIDPDPHSKPLVSRNGQYSIPSDNPLAADGKPQTLDEIYAYGFRNPHRISWDPDTGKLFAADIGEHQIEEINLIEAGRNYGWAEREGTFVLAGAPLPPEDATLGFTYPVAQFDHDEGGPGGNTAVAGGFVYRGRAIPKLQGQFVFGEIASGRIFYADVDELIAADDADPTTTATIQELQLVHEGKNRDLIDIVAAAMGQDQVERTDLRLAVDDAGELYVTTKQDGYIRKLLQPLMAGDANMDFQFDQHDLVQVQIRAKYLTGQQATWGDGDWNSAPGGSLGAPPLGDGQFDQLDIVAALTADIYLTGPYGATAALERRVGSMGFDEAARDGFGKDIVQGGMAAEGMLGQGAGLANGSVTPVPEPPAWLLMLLGVVVLLSLFRPSAA